MKRINHNSSYLLKRIDGRAIAYQSDSFGSGVGAVTIEALRRKSITCRNRVRVQRMTNVVTEPVGTTLTSWSGWSALHSDGFGECGLGSNALQR